MSVQSANRRISSRFGMEIRDPWADRRVVEFFLGLPEQYLVRDGWTKYLVRIAFRDELAPEVLWRRDKEHLGPRIISRLMLESKDLIDHLFYNQMSEIDRYVDTKSVHALYKQYRRRPQGQTLDIIYELIVLILWLHRVNRI